MTELQTLDLSAMVQLHEADFDKQIATAKRYPRSISRVKEQIVAFATESEDTAAECIYAIPRGGSVIKGPSARLAEIVGTSFGNARYATRIVDEGPVFITAQAVFHDLESNSMMSQEVLRRITTKQDVRFETDMIQVTAQAAMSIALRNVILKGVPRSIWGDAYAKCMALIEGTFETVVKRRAAALEAFKKLGVDQPLVLALLEREGLHDITPEDLITLRGTLTAIRDGESSVRQIFGAFDNARSAGKADTGGKLRQGRENEAARNNGAGDQRGGSQDSNPPAPAGSESDVSRDHSKGPAVGSTGTEKPADEKPAHVVAADGSTNGVKDTATPAAEKPATETAQPAEAEIEDEPDLSPATLGILAKDWTEEVATLLTDFAKALAASKTIGAINKTDGAWAQKWESFGEDVAAGARSLRSDRSKMLRAAAAKTPAAEKL